MIWSLLFAHFLVDFVLQSKKTAENKLDLKETIIHSLWIFFVTLIVTIFFGYWNWNVLLLVLIIAITHGVIDFSKARLDDKLGCKWKWLFFAGDQILHITIIFGGIIILVPNLKPGYLVKISEIFLTNDLMKILSFLILITFGGSYFTASVCEAFKPSDSSDKSLDRAGRYIGILERLIVAASILIGRYEIIGFLIAAKSIIRHTETNNKVFAEYFLIGTFTSFIWAALFSYLYLLL